MTSSRPICTVGLVSLWAALPSGLSAVGGDDHQPPGIDLDQVRSLVARLESDP